MSDNNITFSSSPYLVFESIHGDKININNLLLNQRQVVSSELIKVYQYCKESHNIEEICERYGTILFESANNLGLILETPRVWSPLVFENVEIEINTICNYKCEYCPVRFDPKKPKVMGMNDFETIIEKIVQHPTIKNVSLSSYNEPLLDPFFRERVTTIKKHGLSLILHTNGSKLSKSVVDFLNDSGCINEIHVNFPYYDANRYFSITGCNTFSLVCENLEYAIDSGLNLNFSIQKIGSDYKNNLKLMNQLYSDRIGKKINAWETIDRAGLLKNEYAQGIYVSGLLSGCKNVLQWLTINVNGDCFICCNDYYNQHIYGNLLELQLDDIISSSKYQNLMRCIFGETNSSENFICRKCYEMKIMHTYRRMESPIRKKLGCL